MQRLTSRLTVALFSIGLAACGSLSGIHGPPPIGIDGVACVGRTGNPLRAAVPATDEVVLNEARKASGKGGVCAGNVLVVQQEVRVYRLWDSSRESSAFGRWWALTRPEGTRETYRREFAVCASWSALNRLISCTLKPGAVVVIGTTQSADCDEGSYPKSRRTQVYVRNDSSAGQLFVENCRDEGPWP